MAEKRASVAGTSGAESDDWKFLTEQFGAVLADLVCLWADHTRDPRESLDGALTVIRVGGGTPAEYVDRVNEHMMTVDLAAYMRATREEPAK